MFLDEFVESYSKNPNARTDFSFSETNERLYNIIRNETKTESLLASMLWQIITYTPTYLNFCQKNNISPNAPLEEFKPKGERMIIDHYGKYSFLVLDSNYKKTDVETQNIQISNSESADAYENWRIDIMKRSINDQKSSLFPRLVNIVDEEFVAEISKRNTLSLMIASQPDLDYTMAQVPQSPIAVAMHGNNPNSTAGAFAVNKDGKTGMTVSLHALESQAYNVKSGDKLNIGEHSATILSCDQTSDSCFAVFDNPNVDIGFGRGVNGPLSGKSPTQHDTVEFDGVTSGHKNTIIKAWSYEIPFVQPYSQLKVITNPDTNPGDSGSALIDQQDNIIGFAFYRTGITATVQYSTWIWADSVFSAHNIM